MQAVLCIKVKFYIYLYKKSIFIHRILLEISKFPCFKMKTGIFLKFHLFDSFLIMLTEIKIDFRPKTFLDLCDFKWIPFIIKCQRYKQQNNKFWIKLFENSIFIYSRISRFDNFVVNFKLSILIFLRQNLICDT